MSAAEARLIAVALRLAADEIEGAIIGGDIAECAAPAPGERGRTSAVDSRDALYEDPAGWLRKRADAVLGLSGDEPTHEGWDRDHFEVHGCDGSLHVAGDCLGTLR